MKALSLFIFIIFFSNAGCQKSSAKRCIYDLEEFSSVCKRAVAEEEAFDTFKSHPFYQLLYPAQTYEEGWDALLYLQHYHPQMLEEERLRGMDSVGGPQVYDYGAYGVLSPLTLQYMQMVGDLREQVGEMPAGHVIQIGADCGVLCEMLHALSFWKSYTIVDLPEHLALAQKVLQRRGISDVQFVTPEALTLDGKYDIAISYWRFSEFSRPFQKLFVERIFQHARAGYILGHIFPRHFGVNPFTPYELRNYLTKKIPHLEMTEPKGERSNFTISWKTQELKKKS